MPREGGKVTGRKPDKVVKHKEKMVSIKPALKKKKRKK